MDVVDTALRGCGSCQAMGTVLIGYAHYGVELAHYCPVVVKLAEQDVSIVNCI